MTASSPTSSTCDATGAEPLRHVVFLVGRDHYALPLDAVREVVVAPDQYTRVPHAGPAVKGVMTLRGRVVPVVDVARLLTLEPTLPSVTPAKIILLELSRRDLGVLVTEVQGIEPIEQVDRLTSQSRMIRGLTRVNQSSTPATVLDLAGLDATIAAAFAEAPGRK